MNILYLIPLVVLTNTAESTTYRRSNNQVKLEKNEDFFQDNYQAEKEEPSIEEKRIREIEASIEGRRILEKITFFSLVTAAVLYFIYYLLKKLVFAFLDLFE